MCNGGRDLPDVLLQFLEIYNGADIVVAHNLQFDGTMISAEMMRHRAYLEHHLGKALPINIFSDEYTTANKITLYCTMLASKDICDLWVESKPSEKEPIQLKTVTIDLESSADTESELRIIPSSSTTNTNKRASPPRMITLPTASTQKQSPRKYKKFPKLSELYNHLFGYVPENLHNALVDTIVCLRCFLKIRCAYHLSSRKFGLIPPFTPHQLR
jgi:hypothetical protein